MKPAKFYNAKSLSEKLGVHYKTVLYWWKHDKIKGAFRSEISREIMIPVKTAQSLMKQYGVRVES